MGQERVAFPHDSPNWPLVRDLLTELQERLLNETINAHDAAMHVQIVYDACQASQRLDERWMARQHDTSRLWRQGSGVKVDPACLWFGVLKFLGKKAGREEGETFLYTTLPNIIELALRLQESTPPGGLDYSRQQKGGSTVLTRQFITSILASSFLCLFPERVRDRTSKLNVINFTNFFKQLPQSSQVSKLRCVLHYFERTMESGLERPGTITFIRQVADRGTLPTLEDLSGSQTELCRMVVRPSGAIEDVGSSAIQVDFANRSIGGGVLGRGRVQEEIRFITCPELMAAMLFMETMEDNETIIITGFEQFSLCTGYAASLHFAGPFYDKVERDASGNLLNTLVAMDATSFRLGGRQRQYLESCVLREVNKALVGFSRVEQSSSVRRSGDTSWEKDYVSAGGEHTVGVSAAVERLAEVMCRSLLSQGMVEAVRLLTAHTQAAAAGRGGGDGDGDGEGAAMSGAGPHHHHHLMEPLPLDEGSTLSVSPDLSHAHSSSTPRDEAPHALQMPPDDSHAHSGDGNGGNGERVSLPLLGPRTQNGSCDLLEVDYSEWLANFRRRSSQLSDLTSRRSSSSTKHSSEFSSDLEEIYETLVQAEKAQHGVIQEENYGAALTDYASTFVSSLVEEGTSAAAQMLPGLRDFQQGAPPAGTHRPQVVRPTAATPTPAPAAAAVRFSAAGGGGGNGSSDLMPVIKSIRSIKSLGDFHHGFWEEEEEEEEEDGGERDVSVELEAPEEDGEEVRGVYRGVGNMSGGEQQHGAADLVLLVSPAEIPAHVLTFVDSLIDSGFSGGLKEATTFSSATSSARVPPFSSSSSLGTSKAADFPDDVYVWFADKIVQEVLAHVADELYFQRYTAEALWRVAERPINRQIAARGRRRDSSGSDSGSSVTSDRDPSLGQSLPFSDDVDDVRCSSGFQSDSLRQSLAFSDDVDDVRQSLPFSDDVDDVRHSSGFQSDSLRQSLAFSDVSEDSGSQSDRLGQSLPFSDDANVSVDSGSRIRQDLAAFRSDVKAEKGGGGSGELDSGESPRPSVGQGAGAVGPMDPPRLSQDAVDTSAKSQAVTPRPRHQDPADKLPSQGLGGTGSSRFQSQDFPSRSQSRDVASRGLTSQNVLSRPQDVSSRPQGVPSRPKDVSVRPQVAANKPHDVSKRPQDVSRRPPSLSSKPEDVSSSRPQSQAVSSRPQVPSRKPQVVLSARPKDVPSSRPQDVSSRPKVVASSKGLYVSSGAVSKDISGGVLSKDISSGAVSKDMSSGAVSKDISSGAVSKDMSSGAVSKNISSGAVSKNISSGAVSKNISSGAVSKNTLSGARSKDISSGAQEANIRRKSQNALRSHSSESETGDQAAARRKNASARTRSQPNSETLEPRDRRGDEQRKSVTFTVDREERRRGLGCVGLSSSTDPSSGGGAKVRGGLSESAREIARASVSPIAQDIPRGLRSSRSTVSHLFVVKDIPVPVTSGSAGARLVRSSAVREGPAPPPSRTKRDGASFSSSSSSSTKVAGSGLAKAVGSAAASKVAGSTAAKDGVPRSIGATKGVSVVKVGSRPAVYSVEDVSVVANVGSRPAAHSLEDVSSGGSSGISSRAAVASSSSSSASFIATATSSIPQPAPAETLSSPAPSQHPSVFKTSSQTALKPCDIKPADPSSSPYRSPSSSSSDPPPLPALVDAKTGAVNVIKHKASPDRRRAPSLERQRSFSMEDSSSTSYSHSVSSLTRKFEQRSSSAASGGQASGSASSSPPVSHQDDWDLRRGGGGGGGWGEELGASAPPPPPPPPPSLWERDLNLDCYRAAAAIVHQVFQSLPDHLSASELQSLKGSPSSFYYYGRKYESIVGSYETAAAVIGASEKGNVVMSESYVQSKAVAATANSDPTSPRRTRSQSPCFSWLSKRLSRETLTNAFVKVGSHHAVKSYERRSSEPCQRSVTLSLQEFNNSRYGYGYGGDSSSAKRSKNARTDDDVENFKADAWRRGSLDSISLSRRRSSCGFKDPVLSRFAQELISADTSVPPLFLMGSPSTTSTTGSRRSSLSGFRDTTLATFESELLNVSFTGLSQCAPGSPPRHKPRRSHSRESHLQYAPSDSSEAEQWFPIPRRVGVEFQERMERVQRTYSQDHLHDYADFIATTILQQAVSILQRDLQLSQQGRDILFFSDNLADRILRDALSTAATTLSSSSSSSSPSSSQTTTTTTTTTTAAASSVCCGGSKRRSRHRSKPKSVTTDSELDFSVSSNDLTARSLEDRLTDFQDALDASHGSVEMYGSVEGVSGLEMYAAGLAESILRGVYEECGARVHRLVPGGRAVATGNWGCGAFCGDPGLKVALQWVAASLARAPVLLYFTFNDQRVNQLPELVERLSSLRWTVGQLVACVRAYCIVVRDEVEAAGLGVESLHEPAAAAAAGAAAAGEGGGGGGERDEFVPSLSLFDFILMQL